MPSFEQNTFPPSSFASIGTTSLSNPLTGVGRIKITQALFVSGYNWSSSRQGGYIVWNCSEHVDWHKGERDFINNQGLESFGGFRWYNTPDSGSSINFLMVLTNSRNLDIGKRNPQDRLHLIGNIRVDGGYLFRSPDGNELGIIQASDESGTYHSLQIIAKRGDGVIRFATNPTTCITKVVRFANNGNLGIGSTTQQLKLSVNGTATAKQVKVTQPGWLDYIFDTRCQLPELSKTKHSLKQSIVFLIFHPQKKLKVMGWT